MSGTSLPPGDFGVSEQTFIWTEAHRRAASQLEFAVNSQTNITLMLGKPGVGKSRLVEEVVEFVMLDQAVAFFTDPRLLDEDLIGTVRQAVMGLADTYSQKATPIFVIDDAHRLHHDTLTKLLRMSHPPDGGEAVFKLVLVAEPGFDQDMQSIAPGNTGPAFQLWPLDDKDAEAFVDEWLKLRGVSDIFDDEDQRKRMLERAEGVPGALVGALEWHLRRSEKAARANPKPSAGEALRQVEQTTPKADTDTQLAAGKVSEPLRPTPSKPAAPPVQKAPPEAPPQPRPTEGHADGPLKREAAPKSNGKSRAVETPKSETTPKVDAKPEPGIPPKAETRRKVAAKAEPDAPAKADTSAKVTATAEPDATPKASTAPKVSTTPKADPKPKAPAKAETPDTDTERPAPQPFAGVEPEGRFRLEVAVKQQQEFQKELRDLEERESIAEPEIVLQNAGRTLELVAPVLEERPPEPKVAAFTPPEPKRKVIRGLSVAALGALIIAGAVLIPRLSDTAVPPLSLAVPTDTSETVSYAPVMQSVVDLPPDGASILRTAIGLGRSNGSSAAAAYAVAAAKGEARAAYYLGQVYDAGEGVAPNPSMAYLWYKAASSDISAAGTRIEALRTGLSSAQGETVRLAVLHAHKDEAGEGLFLWSAENVGPEMMFNLIFADREGTVLQTLETAIPASHATIPENSETFKIVGTENGETVSTNWMKVAAR